MPLKKKTIKRLASLSAVGAGALGAAAGTAQAGTVSSYVFTTPSGGPQIIGAGYLSTFMLDLPGSNGILLSRQLAGTFFDNSSAVGVAARGSVYFRNLAGFLDMVTGGGATTFGNHGSGSAANLPFARRSVSRWWTTTGGHTVRTWVPPYRFYYSTYRWTSVGSHFTSHWVSGRTTVRSDVNASGNANTSPMYAAFRFYDAGQPYDGWLELSALPPGESVGVTLDAYAYDSPASVPEPSSFVLSGLAALALGAEGLRRWRAARKPAA